MIYIVDGLKFDTDKMERIIAFKEHTETNYVACEIILNTMTDCTLYKSAKGNWLFTYYRNGIFKKRIVPEQEVKQLLLIHDWETYVKYFGEIEEG